MRTVFQIEMEYEGDGPLCFDLNNPETPSILVNYLKDNIDRDEKREFTIVEMTEEAFENLEK
jgi:hypothetical protein